MPAGGGGMSSWGMVLGKRAFPKTRGGRIGAAPVDLYGHNPTEVAQFKSWTGFWFSVVVVLVVVVCCAYVVFEYVTQPYDLAASSVLYDKEMIVGPNEDVLMPDIGVQFGTRNKTLMDVLEHPDVLDILFYQKIQYGDGAGGQCPGKYNGERCTHSVRIPTERCRFLGPKGVVQSYDAFCPKWGNLMEVIKDDIPSLVFVPGEGRENSTMPAIQGRFLDDVYYHLEVETRLNLTGLELHGPELQLAMRDFHGGFMTYIIAYNRLQLFDVKIHDSLTKEFERWTRRLSIKEYLSSSLRVPLIAREVSKGNFVVDFAFLEKEYADVIVGEVVQELNDASHIPSLYDLQNVTNKIPQLYDFETGEFANATVPETIMLSHGSFFVAQLSERITMTPPSTIFDILGTVGGFLSLFSLLIGWPAVLINQALYSRALKKALERGDIPDEYLEADGTVKVDKANEVVQCLQGSGKEKKGKKESNSPSSSKE